MGILLMAAGVPMTLAGSEKAATHSSPAPWAQRTASRSRK
jgi:hypothetical protein